MDGATPRLIGLDWGSSVLRAYVLADGGTVVASRMRPWGIRSVPNNDFAAALDAITGDWRAASPHLALVAAGMVGSSAGWVAAPYCGVPAGAAELARSLVTVDYPRGRLHVIPGIDLGGPAPNVMRGEETQVVGALALAPAVTRGARLIMPGTHSKWIELGDDRVTRFATYMTGEVYAVLAEHSLLGRPFHSARLDTRAAEAEPAWDVFDDAVRRVQASGARGVGALLFLTRSLVLSGRLAAGASLDFLSGLLIGEELRSALGDVRAPLALIGAPALCDRYARALMLFGANDTPVIDNTAPAGLWEIARQAGLIAPVGAAS